MKSLLPPLSVATLALAAAAPAQDGRFSLSALDPELKTREIEIDTDDGRVTLKGRVDSHEEVARAVRMAVEEDDVLEVISTLQVRAAE